MHNIVDIAPILAIIVCIKNNNKSGNKRESSHHMSE